MNRDVFEVFRYFFPKRHYLSRKLELLTSLNVRNVFLNRLEDYTHFLGPVFYS